MDVPVDRGLFSENRDSLRDGRVIVPVGNPVDEAVVKAGLNDLLRADDAGIDGKKDGTALAVVVGPVTNDGLLRLAVGKNNGPLAVSSADEMSH